MGFDVLKYLQDRAGDVGGTVQQNLEGGLRMAGEALGPLVSAPVNYVQEIPDKGAILLLPTAVSKDARTGAGYLKSLMGPLGRPFKIMENPGSSEFYQQTIDAADYDPERQELIFNRNMQNQAEYGRLGRDLSNKDFGQYKGQIMPDGSVMVDDDYDTNRSARWHYERLMSGKSKEGEPLDPLTRAISAASGLHKKLDDAGWTNPRPFGGPGSVKIGTYQR